MGFRQILVGTAVFLLTLLGIVACTGSTAEGDSIGGVEIIASGTVVPPARGAIVVDLLDMGEAPEFRNDVWLNSDDEPVSLADQRGKVVLLEFWTFG